MGQLDEVSHQIGSLNAKVDIILQSKSDYDERIDDVSKKMNDLHLWLKAHDLPGMRKDVDDMKQKQWIRVGLAGGAGVTAGGFLPWLKGVLVHLFS